MRNPLEAGLSAASMVRQMGFDFTRKRWAMSHGSQPVTTTIKGFGPFLLRPGTSDIDVVHQVFRQRQYDLAGFPHYQSLLADYRTILEARLVPLIVDAGANNGASALWFARSFPRARIVAIEPDPGNYQVCVQNTRGFGVDVLNVAIGGQDGRANLSGTGEAWAVTTERGATGEVEVRSMNSILQDYPDGRLYIAKVDIEGFESDLFEGDATWVEQARAVIVEPHDWLFPGRRTSRSFQRVMAEHDQDLLISGENLVYVNAAELTGLRSPVGVADAR